MAILAALLCLSRTLTLLEQPASRIGRRFVIAWLAVAMSLGAVHAQEQPGQPALTPEAKPQMLIAKPKSNPLIPRPRPDPDTIGVDQPSAGAAGPAVAVQAEEPGTDEEACQWRLRALGVSFEPLPADGIDARCDGKALLAIRELAPEISVEPEAVLTCDTVEALAGWMREVVLDAAAKHLTAEPAGIVHLPVDACHTPLLPESSIKPPQAGHETGTAVYVSAITFKVRSPLTLRMRDHETGPDRVFQRVIRIGACGYFPTVLGPGSEPADAAGPQNLYLDRARRPDDGRICR